MERPTQSISYVDLNNFGWTVEFTPLREGDGYKVVSCSYNSRPMQLGDLEASLESLGLDLTAHSMEVNKQYHRPLSCPEAVCDFRFSAPERIDQDWVSSDYSSEDVRIFTSGFKDLNEYISKMRRGGDRS